MVTLGWETEEGREGGFIAIGPAEIGVVGTDGTVGGILVGGPDGAPI